jgi:hypothetical protein
MLAIAFVPPNDIINMCEKIEAYYKRVNCGNIMVLLFVWFKKNLCIASHGLSNHIPEVWSVYERIFNRITRTINGLEGYYRHFNNVCATNNQSIQSLGKDLVKEQFISTRKMNEFFKELFPL